MTTYYDNSTAGQTGTGYEAMLRAHAELERKSAVLSGQGFFAQSLPRSHTVTSAALTGGTIYGVPCYFFAGEIITNLTVAVGAVGSGLTSTKYGVYDTSGNQKGITADIKAVWTSGGDKLAALLSPYTVPSDQFLILAYCATGTTIGVPGRPFGSVNSAGASTETIKMAYTQAGAGSLVDPATFVAGTVPFWVGVS